jgi:methionine synthase II (cobalamin-independent)
MITDKYRFLATGVGSMPFTDADHAVDIAMTRLSECPFWPQLPQLGLNEQMDAQYSEGMPCLVVDREKDRIYFDTSGDYSEDFAEFYEAYLTAMDPDEGTGDCSAMAISQDFAQALPVFEKRLQNNAQKLPFVKMQTTGPCTFALNAVDENKRSIYYNEEFRDVIVKALAMKCRWQIQKFRQFADQVICFIDEPILSAFGSSTYVSVQRDDVVTLLAEMIEAIHADRAMAGIHCCGNTEWSILVDAGVDIVNFDAFEFGESIAIYPEAIQALFARDGMLAWGIVPTSAEIQQQSVETLAPRFETLMDQLASKGIDRQTIVNRAIITPSCGAGSMTPELAEMVFEITQGLSKTMRAKYI